MEHWWREGGKMKATRIIVAVVSLSAMMIAGHPGNAASKAPGTTVYTVPTSIKDDCSVPAAPVDNEIMAWLATEILPAPPSKM